MFEVAGRVGYLVTQLFAWYSFAIRIKLKDIMPLAREFGLALQTVNVIRGIREDNERGWVYIPKKFLAETGLSAEQLFAPEYRQQALKVLDRMTKKAERHLKHALTYVKSLPWWQHGIRLGCIFPLMFAIRTLAVSRNNAEVFGSELGLFFSIIITSLTIIITINTGNKHETYPYTRFGSDRAGYVPARRCAKQ